MEEESDKFDEMKEESDKLVPQEDNDMLSFCIVWTTLPLISWILPIIGHTGICNSNGIIHDFAGPYTININDFAFGSPYKYVKINYSNKEEWNKSITIADNKFKKTMHNLFTNNCHSHVAEVLNNIQYRNRTNWNMVWVWWMCITESRYISYFTVLQTYIFPILFYTFLYLWLAK